MDRAVEVKGLPNLFPEFGDFRLVYLLDSGFERGHTEIHGRALGEEVCS